MRNTLLLLTLVSTPALAVPTTVHHQGRLFDALGAPLTGAHDVDFKIYDTPAGGTELWGESPSVTFDNGFFTYALGTTTGLDDSIFDGGDRWLGLAIDAGPETRIEIDSIPYAIYAETAASADTATNLDGGTINADSIMVNGTSVIDSSGNYVGDISYSQISDPPADPFAGLGCVDGDHLRLASGAWACGTDADMSIAAGQLTGTISATNLPVGSGATDVAAGDHNHAIDALTGVATVSQLPVGDTASDVAAGDHTHANPAPDGSTKALASLSCEQLRNDHPELPSGVYWINAYDPSRTGKATETHCNMETFGGGWTQFMQCLPADNCVANSTSLYQTHWRVADQGSYAADASWLLSGSLRPTIDGARQFMLEVEDGSGNKGYIEFPINDRTLDFFWLGSGQISKMSGFPATIMDSDGSVSRINNYGICFNHGLNGGYTRSYRASNNLTFLGTTATAVSLNPPNNNCDWGPWTSQMLLRQDGSNMSASFGAGSSARWSAQTYSHRLYIK